MYTSEDTSAPSLTGEYGSLINLLTQVLVTGYGSMPSLGWTKEFEDIPNNVAVFRMPAGSRTFLRVDDNYTTYTGRTAKITAYESMSTAHIGIHPCPDPVETYSEWSKSHTVDTIARGWRIIGDDKGFYFLPRTHGSSNVNDDSNWELQYFVHYFGDYINLKPNDVSTFCCSCTNLYDTPSLQSVDINSVSTGFWRMRNSDGELGYSQIGLGAGFYANELLFGNNIELSPLGGKNIYCRSYIHKDLELLGSLPGLLNWIGKYTTGNDEEIKEYYEYEGSDKVSFSVTSYTGVFAVSPYPPSCRRFTIKLGSRFRDA